MPRVWSEWRSSRKLMVSHRQHRRQEPEAGARTQGSCPEIEIGYQSQSGTSTLHYSCKKAGKLVSLRNV
jgi:hypothetical protein